MRYQGFIYCFFSLFCFLNIFDLQANSLDSSYSEQELSIGFSLGDHWMSNGELELSSVNGLLPKHTKYRPIIPSNVVLQNIGESFLTKNTLAVGSSPYSNNDEHPPGNEIEDAIASAMSPERPLIKKDRNGDLLPVKLPGNDYFFGKLDSFSMDKVCFNSWAIALSLKSFSAQQVFIGFNVQARLFKQQYKTIITSTEMKDGAVFNPDPIDRYTITNVDIIPPADRVSGTAKVTSSSEIVPNIGQNGLIAVRGDGIINAHEYTRKYGYSGDISLGKRIKFFDHILLDLFVFYGYGITEFSLKKYKKKDKKELDEAIRLSVNEFFFQRLKEKDNSMTKDKADQYLNTLVDYNYQNTHKNQRTKGSMLGIGATINFGKSYAFTLKYFKAKHQGGIFGNDLQSQALEFVVQFIL